MKNSPSITNHHYIHSKARTLSIDFQLLPEVAPLLSTRYALKVSDAASPRGHCKPPAFVNHYIPGRRFDGATARA